MVFAVNNGSSIELGKRDVNLKPGSNDLAFLRVAQDRFSKVPKDGYVRSDKKWTCAWLWTGVKCFLNFESTIEKSKVALLESGDRDGLNKLEEGLENSRLRMASKVGKIAFAVTAIALGILLGAAIIATPFGWAAIAGIVLASAIGARILGIGGTLLYYFAKDGVKDKISLDFSIVERIHKKKQYEGHNYDQIFKTENAKLFLGALPNRVTADIEDLRKEGIKAVVSVNQPWERRPWSISVPYTDADYDKVGMDYKKLQVNDHQYPSLEQLHHIADYTHAKMEIGKSVYIHCRAGHGRSAMLLAAYLIKHQNMTAEQAVKQVKDNRSQSTVQKKLEDKGPEVVGRTGLKSFEKMCRAEEARLAAKNDQIVGGLAGLLLGAFNYARSYL